MCTTGLDEFLQARPRLYRIACRIAGNSHEAEELVQDVWVRWQRTDRTRVTDPQAFLVTTVSRLAINLVQSARRRHETAAGPWLADERFADEQFATGRIATGGIATGGIATGCIATGCIATGCIATGPDPQQAAENQEAYAVAARLMSERLSPSERATYVLREGFGYPYRDIAETLRIGTPNARQLAKRARDRLAAEPAPRPPGSLTTASI
ncbi:sigma-70 family RNA polymerase sigma factor [Kribbella sp. NPDC048915]|uniref:sigma-70 family RNA polymerase sigma factor n=1 Tax=Kribbella sp. NPDC048915 TaxID=3155148 RepID=UPI0033EE86E0